MSSPLPIIIDVREACRTQRDGKGQWTFGMVSELLRREVPVMLLTDSPLPPQWTGHAPVQEIPARGFRWHLQAAAVLRTLQHNNAMRFYLSPVSYIVPAMVGGTVPCVPVVHDLIAFHGSTLLTTGSEPHNRKATFIEKLTLGSAVKKSVHVLTISESTRADVLNRYPALDAKKLSTVFAGPMREDVVRNASDGMTILCIATLSPRKNQARLIRAYASLPEEVRKHARLVLAGAKGWHCDDVIALARGTRGVEWRDYVATEEYERLLHTCAVFALPSLYEGFGMQILDALQRGCVILTSDRGSLREVAGTAALTVDPESVPSIAQGLERALRDDALRKKLSEEGPEQAGKFSWKRTADLLLAATETIGR